MKSFPIEICDVTLRDGEQTPGVSFTCKEKQDIAQSLSDIGIEIIEAGFPSVSTEEKKTIKAIVEMELPSRICCLARCVQSDIDAALDCGVDLVSIFFATSDLHIRVKYHKTREQMLDTALSMLDYAVDHGLSVRFSAEDASRTDIGFLKQMYREGAERGAAYSSFADTIGCMTPIMMYDVVREIKKDLKNPLCVHCHNDLGFASANTFTASQAGAFQLHTTVNGIGERCGNASLEEVLVALRMHNKTDRYDLTELTKLSKLVEQYSGVLVAKTKPVVGEHAFVHESGIHIAALIKDPQTYEYYPPEMVGAKQKLMLGKHTGRKGLEHILTTLGYTCSNEQTDEILEKIKAAAEAKQSITAEYLSEIIAETRSSAS
ncbi:homocitrate synthase family protein [Methanorbis rubei]|uniref:Probable 2-isopropylmalate synthase n=1 Tax=Methanorbis rubei TaxID=3028300 RepID=A0AAE4MH91_9EURY|nr:2-isopropylmalate synthase [Methanocorpusculaceae archaeon Cs1]